MRTTIVILIGVVLAVAFDAVTGVLHRRAGRSVDGTRGLLWTWLAFTLADFGIGVAAGHGAAVELAIHALVFAIPGAAALVLARRRRLQGGKS